MGDVWHTIISILFYGGLGGELAAFLYILYQLRSGKTNWKIFAGQLSIIVVGLAILIVTYWRWMRMYGK